MADKLQTEHLDSNQTAHLIDQTAQMISSQRKAFERRWYDNNFFDDGFHYRYVSRTTGRIIDLSQSGDTFIPHRAIPKASRQIRGIANLLVANDLKPVIYPDKISPTTYQDPAQYEQAMQNATNTAKQVGYWVEDEWKILHMKEKLIQMIIGAAKHSISFMEIWPDSVSGKIKSGVYDAFDIMLRGDFKSLEELPIIIKSVPQLVSEIKANKDFDPEQVAKLNPDNKYASSEIKDAYMMARFGMTRPSDRSATIILKEGFIKEFINGNNAQKVKADIGPEAFSKKKKGDKIIRQMFEAAGVWVRDKYINLPDYPFVDFRFEPGSLYQVPLIERFMPANKSLDSVMSRLERHIGTMVVGAWSRRKGETFKINNISGGLELEWEVAPPTQIPIMPIPNHVFNYIQLLENFIEEQGASASSLAQLPSGVKSGVAIENLKASEYANLKIATDQLKDTVRRTAEKMMDIAAENYITPVPVYYTEEGIPKYFDVIGQKGYDKYKEIADKTQGSMPNAVLIKDDYRVNVEVESGLGYTEEGKRATMLQIITFIQGLAQQGYMTPEAVGVIIKKFMNIFQFGATAEFMDAYEGGTPPITEKQLTEIKVALMEVVKDMQGAGQPAQPTQSLGTEAPAQTSEEQDILKIKTAVMSAFADMKNATGEQQTEQPTEQAVAPLQEGA